MTIVRVRRKPLWVMEVSATLKDGRTISERTAVRADSISEAMDDQDALNKIAWSVLEAQFDEPDVVGLSLTLRRDGS